MHAEAFPRLASTYLQLDGLRQQLGKRFGADRHVCSKAAMIGSICSWHLRETWSAVRLDSAAVHLANLPRIPPSNLHQE